MIHGKVSSLVYWRYFSPGGRGYFSLIFLIFSLLLAQVFITGSDYWMTIWAHSEQLRASNNNIQSRAILSFPSQSTHYDDDTITYIYVYSFLIVGVIVFSVMRTLHFYAVCLASSVSLHNRMLQGVIRTRLNFFERNPIGILSPNLKIYLRRLN